MPATIAITVNGEPIETSSATLAALLDELGHGTAKVATAINGTFVPERARADSAVNAADAIEIVSARQGG